MNRWRERIEREFPLVVERSALTSRAATAMAELLTSGVYEGARAVAFRSSEALDGPQAIVVEVDVPMGQRTPVNDIRPSEPVALRYGRGPAQAYPLRGDFPEDVPHLNLSYADHPRSLCLYDMPPDEVLHRSTPHRLIERIRWWLAETAHGRLHGADQPLDPVFATMGDTLVLPPEGLAGISGSDVLVLPMDGAGGAPLQVVPVGRTASAAKGIHAASRFATMALLTVPVAHRDINRPPRTLRDLVDAFSEFGADLLGPLRSEFARWAASADGMRLLANAWLLILVVPIERSPGEVDGHSVLAFQTEGVDAGRVAEALGALLIEGGAASRPITYAPLDDRAGRDIALKVLDVHHPIDRLLARQCSGRADGGSDDLRIALVGAGAIGSHFALTAARAGIGRWHVVDPDFLLPHNVARHALPAGHVGRPKATALAAEILAILGSASATALVERVDAETVAPVLRSADVVIDASASVPAARWMARDAGHAARTVSIFFNPTGSDLVVLVEGSARSPAIDHVEMAYYWLLVNERLQTHLGDRPEGMRPSGGCRAASMRMSPSRVGALASFAVDRVFRDLPEAGAVEVWSLSDDGLSSRRRVPPRYREFTLGAFTVVLSKEVVAEIVDTRSARLPGETGGVLIGSWDRQRDLLYVVAVVGAPTDSASSPTGFVRGTAGMRESLEDVERLTGGNLTYVGEWHSHPPAYATTPSEDDKILLKWIAEALRFSDVPPCMLIAGDEEIRIIVDHHANSASCPST